MLKSGDAVEIVITASEQTKLCVRSITIEIWIDNVPVHTIVVVGSDLFKTPEVSIRRGDDV